MWIPQNVCCSTTILLTGQMCPWSVPVNSTFSLFLCSFGCSDQGQHVLAVDVITCFLLAMLPHATLSQLKVSVQGP